VRAHPKTMGSRAAALMPSPCSTSKGAINIVTNAADMQPTHYKLDSAVAPCLPHLMQPHNCPCSCCVEQKVAMSHMH
jgi:hypothetical protein